MNNLSLKIVALVVVSFVGGFGIATGAFMITICQDCIQATPLKTDPVKKCDNDPRCINDEGGVSPPNELTDKGWHKVSIILEIVNDPVIQESLQKSNNEFSEMSPSVREQTMAKREKEWISAKQPTPFMLSIINNNIADFLREKTRVPSEEFGEVVFGEHILTNIYGPNVAVTIRTDNYRQDKDDWWLLANNVELLVRNCDWDESAQMNSEDIVIRIINENNEFVGIMNSATPCNVLKEGISQFPTDV